MNVTSGVVWGFSQLALKHVVAQSDNVSWRRGDVPTERHPTDSPTPFSPPSVVFSNLSYLAVASGA
jgi:hypothetical protein